jgi:hypothetical protein
MVFNLPLVKLRNANDKFPADTSHRKSGPKAFDCVNELVDNESCIPYVEPFPLEKRYFSRLWLKEMIT